MWAVSCLTSCCATCACGLCTSAAVTDSDLRRSKVPAAARPFRCSGKTSRCNRFRRPEGQPSKRSARFAYCGLFALSLIVSWILRETAAPLLEKMPWINTFSHTPSKEWFQTDAVLRVSLGNFLFFIAFALMMIGVKDQNDKRDSWHHGGWVLKIVVWAVLIVLMFFLANVIITIYGLDVQVQYHDPVALGAGSVAAQ